MNGSVTSLILNVGKPACQHRVDTQNVLYRSLWHCRAHTRKSSHEVEQSLRPEIGKVDLLHFHLTNDDRQFVMLALVPRRFISADLHDSKSTSGGVLCIFGDRTCVPILWMCKKPTAVFSQQHGGRGDLFGRKTANGWFDRLMFMGMCCRCLLTCQQSRRILHAQSSTV